MSDLEPKPAVSEPAPAPVVAAPPVPVAEVVAPAPPPVPAPTSWNVQNEVALAKARGLMRYVDSILFSIDEPPEGGRVLAASIVLERAVEALITSIDPTFVGPSIDHAFWLTLKPQPLPMAWRSKRETESELLEARKVAWAGLSTIEAPQREKTLGAAKRAAKFIVLAGVAFAVVIGIASLVRNRPQPPGLLAGRPINTSSKLGRDPGSAKLLFHTELEFRPWAEWDLGAPTKLHEVVVSNRSDCCDERALPLVVEVSDDRTRWTEVARRTEAFGANMQIPFNEIEARYLRLRVDRESFLHLEYVEAR